MPHNKIANVTEALGYSAESFEDAACEALRRAGRSLAGIRGLEILGKKATVEGNRIVKYEVWMKLVFEIAPDLEMHE